MKKFNGFDNWILTEALKLFAEEAEQEVKNAENNGKNLIYAPGFFKNTADSLKMKIDDMTLKAHKRYE